MVDGEMKELSLEKLLKRMRQDLHCSGAIKTTGEGKYIQLSGDQRAVAKKVSIGQRFGG